jgi:hypothetical protein
LSGFSNVRWCEDLPVFAEGKELVDQSFVLIRVVAQSEIGASETAVVLDLVVPRLSRLLANKLQHKKGLWNIRVCESLKALQSQSKSIEGGYGPSDSCSSNLYQPKVALQEVRIRNRER